MMDNRVINPYEAASAPSKTASGGLTGLQRVVLILMAIVLFLRGGFMLFALITQLSLGMRIDSNFYAAILTKDSLYCVSACVGAIMLFVFPKVGWWSSLVHWCWYLACEVFVLLTAAALAWQLPVRHEPPTLYAVLALTMVLGWGGLAILLWRPIATACNAPVSKRYAVAAGVLLCAVLLAFAVNGWMSTR